MSVNIMKVAIGADHRGVEYKSRVIKILNELDYEVKDFGPNSEDPVDYPDFGLKVARAVANGEVDYGITICMTGNGMNIAANKIKGIRAGLALNAEMAYFTRLHNNANVLTLSSKYTNENELKQILKEFFNTKFEGGRHIARVQKIIDAENN
ncbi:MAG: ribose 5-phosphate isomerase B [candidate division Zixibacteria bacterium]|nr:ribose 5-phosphate isomerase B [candidate division Zixibacteria bacterium]